MATSANDPGDSSSARPAAARPAGEARDPNRRQPSSERPGAKARGRRWSPRRRRRARRTLLVAILAAAALIGSDLAHGATLPPWSRPRPAADLHGARSARSPRPPVAGRSVTDPDVAPSALNPPAPPEPGPVAGPRTFSYAEGPGPVAGTAGPVLRFHLAVERQVGQEAAAFATAVDAILGDPRSWIAAERFRFQRVPVDTDAEFTIFLATPVTSAEMCTTGGLDTEMFTSCRVPGQVIINLARWLTAIPGYGADLDVYRAYAINHEVGHELGLGHEACPAAGQPAPVMQQQTYGLQGCTANAWPYLDGRRYAGPEVP